MPPDVAQGLAEMSFELLSVGRIANPSYCHLASLFLQSAFYAKERAARRLQTTEDLEFGDLVTR